MYTATSNQHHLKSVCHTQPEMEPHTEIKEGDLWLARAVMHFLRHSHRTAEVGRGLWTSPGSPHPTQGRHSSELRVPPQMEAPQPLWANSSCGSPPSQQNPFCAETGLLGFPQTLPLALSWVPLRSPGSVCPALSHRN